MTGRRATVSHGTDGVGETYGGGTASSIAAAANAAAAVLRGGGDCSGGGETKRRRVQVDPPISSSNFRGGGEPRSGFPLSLSHATWRGHIKTVFSFSKRHTRYSSSLPYIGERKRGVCPKGSPVIQGVWPKRMG